MNKKKTKNKIGGETGGCGNIEDIKREKDVKETFQETKHVNQERGKTAERKVSETVRGSEKRQIC